MASSLGMIQTMLITINRITVPSTSACGLENAARSSATNRHGAERNAGAGDLEGGEFADEIARGNAVLGLGQDGFQCGLKKAGPATKVKKTAPPSHTAALRAATRATIFLG